MTHSDTKDLIGERFKLSSLDGYVEYEVTSVTGKWAHVTMVSDFPGAEMYADPVISAYGNLIHVLALTRLLR